LQADHIFLQSEQQTVEGSSRKAVRRMRFRLEVPVHASRQIATGCVRALVLLFAASGVGQTGAVRTFPLDTATGLEANNAKVEAVAYQGRKAIRLTTDAPDDAIFVPLPGSDFQDGVIEADVAVKVTMPPGVRWAGFGGIAFRAKRDGSEYEAFYVRPKNALSDDQAMRNHSVQYVAEPGFGWYRLRREWPIVYESYADIEPETWTHLKIEVAGRSAKIFLNGSTKPNLVVDGLKSPNLRGGVALWGFSGEESYFSNVRITPAAALPVRNGSDAAGTWTVQCGSDAGRFEGSMKLTREGSKLMGTWTGTLGDNKPITGTWRDGYVELSFPVEWPENRNGAAGPTAAHMAGWIDDAAGKGRMSVEGRAEGQWVAERKSQY
jgi:hypothetical protein